MSKEFVKMQMGFENIRESVVKLHDALNKKFPGQNVIEIENAHELVKMASGHFMLDGKTPLEDLDDEEIKIISDFLLLSEDADINRMIPDADGIGDGPKSDDSQEGENALIPD